MKAPVSCCIIVKNDPHLKHAVASIRDYVEEIVIVDTGSSPEFQREARELADVFEIYTECNDPETGLIEDFSKARQRSFDLANEKFWILWMDSDDRVVGGANLINLTNAKEANGNSISFMFPYEYSYNEAEQCTCLHYRERLFSNKNDFHWINPVHEVVIPNDSTKVTFVTNDSVTYKHQRQYSNKAPESGRNLRILKKYFEKVGETDARQMYYIGLEYLNNGFVEEAIGHLSKYVDISGWDDERAMACLKLIDIYMGLSDYESCLKWAFKTISIKENWGEGYFALGKIFYFLAIQGGPNEQRQWERCAYFSRLGLGLPVTKTLLFVNPLDRDYDIHRYLNMALSKLGDVEGAAESVNIALKSQPNDRALLNNKTIYENWLKDKEVSFHFEKIKELSKSNQQAQNIINLLSNSVGIITDDQSQTWQIPNGCNVDGLPLNLNNDQLQACVIMFWKQFMLYDQGAAALSFLENAPGNTREHAATQKALELTRNFLRSEAELAAVKKRTNGSLDIVFFAGDGIEVWTPDTVRKSGIGGSELMLLEMAKRLAALGHKVRVYNSCGFFGAGMYDGVQYNQTDKFRDLECDVLVVSRNAQALDDSYNIKSKLKLLWVHDLYIGNYKNELALKADRILALSDFHKNLLIQTHNLHPSHLIKTRNGIDLKRFVGKNIKRDKYKCINSSSPDRAWPVLLSVWGKIKERVPEATLTLAYGWKNWEYSAQWDKLQQDLIQRLKDQIEEMKPLGVNFIGRVSQERLAEEMLSSSVSVHPTWFQETSGITFMENQMSGLRIVSSAIGALNETVNDRGILISGEWTSEAFQNSFINSTISTLLGED